MLEHVLKYSGNDMIYCYKYSLSKSFVLCFVADDDNTPLCDSPPGDMNTHKANLRHVHSVVSIFAIFRLLLRVLLAIKSTTNYYRHGLHFYV